MSLIEAYIDFPDEEIPSEVLTHTKDNINNLCNFLSIYTSYESLQSFIFDFYHQTKEKIAYSAETKMLVNNLKK